jgi:hypothetical protein
MTITSWEKDKPSPLFLILNTWLITTLSVCLLHKGFAFTIVLKPILPIWKTVAFRLLKRDSYLAVFFSQHLQCKNLETAYIELSQLTLKA